MMIFVAVALALGGAVLLLMAIRMSYGVSKIVPHGHRGKWQGLVFLIYCFVAGYVGYIIVLISQFPFPVEALVGSVFISGALFVLGIISLSRHSLGELHRLNENLERMVSDRTRELADANQSLTASEGQLGKQKVFLETVLDSLAHPFYVINISDYSIAMANKASDFSSRLPLIKTCHELTHNQANPCCGDEHPCPIQKVLRTGKQVVVEHVHRNSQGEERNVAVHGHPLYDSDGKLVQMIEYVLDITDQKRVEREMVLARKAAEQANTSKSEFLANMSHEVRTPMNAILGMTNLTLATELTPVQRHYITTVQDSSELLLNIINDILDLSKIEAGKLELDERPFNLNQVLNAVIRVLNIKAVDKGLDLVLKISDTPLVNLLGDDLRLRQVVINLVANAIKFTRKGSVVIDYELEETGDGRVVVRISVTDTGMGIPAAAQEKIFDSFHQADSSITRNHGGTGLGLTICKRLVAIMGGEIGVTSTEGQGSCFFFSAVFDGMNGDADTDIFSGQAPVFGEPLRILLVDDITTNRDLARILLEQAGHSVIEADNGLAALKRLSETPCDVMLLDIQMPGLDGYQVTEYLRICEEVAVPRFDKFGETLAGVAARVFGKHLPVIAMTAHAMSGDKEKCLMAGMDGYVSKPLIPDDLYRQLNICCGRR